MGEQSEPKTPGTGVLEKFSENIFKIFKNKNKFRRLRRNLFLFLKILKIFSENFEQVTGWGEQMGDFVAQVRAGGANLGDKVAQGAGRGKFFELAKKIFASERARSPMVAG